MSQSTLNHIQKVADSVIKILENKNFEDQQDIQNCWFELNTDILEGKIKGREEAVELIRKAFLMNGDE